MFSSGTSTQKRANLKAAYSAADQAYASYGANKERIIGSYNTGLANARAKLGASGMNTEDTAWQGMTGKLVRNRDEDMGAVEERQKLFKGGEAYKLVKEDFKKRMGLSGGGRISTVSASSGEGYFTDEQKGMLQSYTPDPNSVSGGYYAPTMTKYARSLKPTWKEYEKYRFGTAQEKAAFSDSMTARIEASNKKYRMDARVAGAVRQDRQSFYSGVSGDKAVTFAPQRKDRRGSSSVSGDKAVTFAPYRKGGGR